MLKVRGATSAGYRVLRCKSPAIPNAIAALLLYIRDAPASIPHAYFGWTEGNPITYLLKFLAFGEGDTAPVTREVLRQAEPDPATRGRAFTSAERASARDTGRRPPRRAPCRTDPMVDSALMSCRVVLAFRVLALFLLCVLQSLGARASADSDPSPFAALRWRLIGPFRAGRVSAGAVDPADPNTYYFGTPGGGVWKSTNAGQTWAPMFDRPGWRRSARSRSRRRTRR